jgi:hypothetical protein
VRCSTREGEGKKKNCGLKGTPNFIEGKKMVFSVTARLRYLDVRSLKVSHTETNVFQRQEKQEQVRAAIKLSIFRVERRLQSRQILQQSYKWTTRVTLSTHIQKKKKNLIFHIRKSNSE